MALRFRTLFPFAIPGVLALIGWWWFSSRKKERVSNHDRRDVASLEEHRIGSPMREPCSREGVQLSNELSFPLEAKRPADPAHTFKSLAELPAPSELRAQRQDSSADRPIEMKTTIESNTLQDDSDKLEAMGCKSGSGSPSQEPSLLDAQSADESHVGEAAIEKKLDSTQAAGQLPTTVSTTAALLESCCLEKSGDSGTEEAVQADSLEKPLKEGQCPVVTISLDADSLPAPCSKAASEAVSQAPVDPVGKGEVSSGRVGAVETEAGVPAKCVEPANSESSQVEEMSSLNVGSTLKRYGFGDVGYKGSLEKERVGGISLDKEEVEKIEQVAIHIISNVIRAATEEVLSGSVNDMSGRICQMASRVDKPLEKMSMGAVGQAEPSKGNECMAAEKATAVELTPLLEENVNRHAMYSSHLTHGLLVNPSHSQPRDSLSAERPVGNPSVVANHEEEFEDAQTVTEDSGCSACTSEDGVSVEDLLKSTSSPALGQRLDLLNMSTIKDSEHKLVSSKKPPSPTLVESKVPYSNGVLKEDCPHLRHEQPWAVEADADNSGGSDVNSMDSVDIGCALRNKDSSPNSKMGGDSNKTELVIWEIEVPKHLVGRLIGKQGRYVSFLKQTSGAKIYISTLPYTQDFQICHIEGSQQNVDKALSLIGKKFKDLSLTNIYAPPPPPLPLHSLPMTSWLMLPDGVTVEVIVVNQVNAGHLFVQQHTHPTFHVLRSLDQQMYLCYSQPGIPTMPTPVEVGVVCAAPGMEGAWWRAQVVGYFKDTNEVEIRYVDYGGYERVKIDTLRQIRSDFVTLPFQGAEVLLDNVVPLPDDDHFSSEADTAVSEMTRGTPLLAQVTNYDSATGLPLIQLWSMIGDELVSINRTLVERGFAQWIESY
ncbi:A-kinase anchor protein 1, mitochondrial [Rhineura floridana]|uniref:A-kinase anchor protein 1, mitochondrial n=1 Tax=Rhineura floridana TaxID=261503 RepID=UPI002AC845AE|nr:A-kinase anchor protein 1, mitochondrial [Rhineura floridana]XP_061460994.1 A-kinase anchor protein 1, mitochondrial [Rhineura floridana]XP_061460995.1 A-kinase anchor protein 1, mitochondrial [Rhineura floridana]XP_061460996.1 A-kinase anchor protein 1, mitochondrial [Rhineura floridana]